MIILGINAGHGDASAAILVDGVVVAAAEEERFTRVKHAAGLPLNAVRYCLRAVGARLRDVEVMAVSRDQGAHLGRRLLSLARRPRSWVALAARRSGATCLRRLPELLSGRLGEEPPRRGRLVHVEHHVAHLASAYFCAPFDRAAVLSLDGLGDHVSTMWAVASGPRLQVLGAIHFPHSLGFLYTAVSQWLGFDGYGEEYKVMALAGHGAPELLQLFRRLVRAARPLSYRLDLGCFRHRQEWPVLEWAGGAPVIPRLWDRGLAALLGPPRQRGGPVEERHLAVAASLQARLEEVLIEMAAELARRTGERNLCLAGGVALNCVANGRLLRDGVVDRLFVQPAAHDAGTAVGAALAAYHATGAPRRFVLKHAFLGPAVTEQRAGAALAAAEGPLADAGCRVERLGERELLCERVAAALARGAVVGWMQGAMEFGPRALGNRSILADPRRASLVGRINRVVKRREAFRPFAPAVRAEVAGELFEDIRPSPFMTATFRARPGWRRRIPAVIHVDGSARVQTVDAESAPLFRQLLCAFERRTGVPALLNTSFNEQEPIVCDETDGLACFLRSGMDAVAIGSYLVERGAGKLGDAPPFP